MRRTLPFIVFLALLSALSGWFMSKMSWLGRVGVNWMHKEYKFLKVWYEGGAVVFVVLLILFGLQSLVQRKASKGTSRGVHILALLLAVAGLYFTYQDFRTDITHRILNERFHIGAYLFWAGWMSISLFLLVMGNVKDPSAQRLR